MYILSNKHKFKFLIDFFRIILLISICIYIIYRVADTLDLFIENINSGAEETSVKNGDEFFVSNGNYFDNALYRSQEQKLSGNYSVKLTPENQYGFSITLDVPKINETYEMSVWYYNTYSNNDSIGFATIVASSGSELWKGAFNILENKNGWKKVHLKFTIPDQKYLKPLVIYCWNNSKNIVFFDDINIKRKNWKMIFNF